MNTTELKKLADKCICHPISRSISDVESAGEAIKELLAINAELVEALNWYAEQARLCRLIHSEGDSGRKALDADGGQKARAALAKAEGVEL